jgi:LacI family transcriptional regulator
MSIAVAGAISRGYPSSTVSRALNGYADVSAKTRARVEAAAKAIGYQPHPVAHRLATGRTGAIALVSSVRSRQLSGCNVCSLAGRRWLTHCVRMAISPCLWCCRPAKTKWTSLSRFLDGRLVDGVLSWRALARNDPRVALLQQRKVPFVTHGGTVSNASACLVDTDNEQAFFLAAERLIGLGHHRIATDQWTSEHDFCRFARDKGSAAHLPGKYGLDPTLCPVRHGEVSAASGEQIATELIASNYCRMATRANRYQIDCHDLRHRRQLRLAPWRAIRQAAHLTVGRDISVIGYGNTEAGLYADPPLTTT